MTDDETAEAADALVNGLDAGLRECRRLRAWLQAPLPAELRVRLEADLRRVEGSIATTLLAAQDLGGRVLVELDAGLPGADRAETGADASEVEGAGPAETGADPMEVDDADPPLTVDPKPITAAEAGAGSAGGTAGGVAGGGARVEPAVGAGAVVARSEAGPPPRPAPTDSASPAVGSTSPPIGATGPEVRSTAPGVTSPAAVRATEPAPKEPAATPRPAAAAPPPAGPVKKADATLLQQLVERGLQKPAPPASPVTRGSDGVRRAMHEAVALSGREAANAIIATISGWTSFSSQDQVLLLEIAAAKLRAEQDLGLDVDRDFRSLAAFSKKERPGLAYGLALGHTPRRGSWANDARELLARLVPQAAGPVAPNAEKELGALRLEFAAYLEAATAGEEDRAESAKVSWMRRLGGCFEAGVRRDDPRLIALFRDHSFVLDGPAFTKLRKAIRDEDDVAETGSERDSLPPDWPWFRFTRGKRALMIGGDPREPHRTRVHEAFGFAELDWLATEFSRNPTQKARSRIESGALDLVLPLHRWCPHKVDETLQPACKLRGIPYIPVQNSYGVTGLRTALERFVKL